MADYVAEFIESNDRLILNDAWKINTPICLEDTNGYFSMSGMYSYDSDFEYYRINPDEVLRAPTEGALIGKVINNDNVIYNKGRVIKTFYQMDQVSRTFGTSWADGKTFDNFTKQAGSNILLSYGIPTRNPTDANWGGAYIEINYSVDGGSNWTSLGDSGYDSSMTSGAQNIDTSNGTFLLDLDAIRNATQLRIKFRHRSYTDTVSINVNHAITGGALGWAFTNLTLIEIDT